MKLLQWLLPERKDASVLYTEALESLLNNDTDTALRKLRELVKTDTSNVSAYVKLANILRKKNRVGQAVKIHQSLTIRPGLKTDQKVEIYTALAKDYLALGQLVRAEEIGNRILRLDRKNRWAAEFLVQMAEDQKHWEKASDYLKRVERITGQNESRRHAYFRMMQGLEREEQGEYDRARDDYLRAARMDGSYAEPHLYLGNLYERENDLQRAVQNWMRFAELAPLSGKQVFARLEKALFELGRFGEIENFYRKIISNDSDNIEAISGLVNVLQAKGEINQAMALVDDTLVHKKSSIRARLTRLKLELHKINQDQLSAEVERIAELIPSGNSWPMHTT